MTISSSVSTQEGNLSNVLIWDPSSFWMTTGEALNPSFTITPLSPLYIHRVEIMSRDNGSAYTKKWKLEATKENGEIVSLLENKPGLCDRNNYEHENNEFGGTGHLCSTTTISKYLVNSNIQCYSIIFTSLNRSHNSPASNLDISSIRFFGSLWPISFCSKCYLNPSPKLIYYIIMIISIK